MTQPASTITHELDAIGAWLWPACDELPRGVVERAQRLWLDTASCAWSGFQAPELQAWLRLQADGDAGAVSLPGTPVRLAAGAATMSFAQAACWDEACEGIAVAHGRPGVAVVSALWPELASGRLTWRALWQATAVGYEIGARLGALLRIKRGMHVDAFWSAFGAAAALVRARGGDWACARRAIEACACQLPFSLYRPIREGANVRNTYLGHGAWLGVQAAHAALAGLAMPQGALDDVIDLALEGAPSGHVPPAGEWLLLHSYWKPFAAVRHVHYGAQAALSLRHVLPAGEVPEAMELTIYPEAVQYCGNRAPRSVIAAQFSLTYGLAAAWIHGDLSPAEFRAPKFEDARVRALEERVVVQPDAARYPGVTRGAHLLVRHGGRSWEHEQGAVTGDPGREPGDAEVLAKFDQYTQRDEAMAAWSRALRASPQDAGAVLPQGATA
jgi:2-methylcitrate dehydratase PrpD